MMIDDLDQTDMFLGSAYSRAGDPIESSTAAARMLGRAATELENRVLGLLRISPYTSREMADLIGTGRDSISPRMKPLKRAGLVERSGERRDGCAVWTLV